MKLIVSGFDPESVDANSVVVEINGQDFFPYAVIRLNDEGTDMAKIDDVARLTGIEIIIPGSIQTGIARARIKHGDAQASEAISLEVLEPQRIAPRIDLITNIVDGAVDVYATGEKSVFRVFAHGLDDTATPENVLVLVGEHKIRPSSISFLPGNGVHMVIAKMPENISPGEAGMRIQFNGLASENVQITIR